MKGAYHVLFEQVRRCAAQLELIDPNHRNAEQEIAKVVLTLMLASITMAHR